MNLLLDTHVWIWSLLEPTKLARKVTKALHNPENELWLSPISTWEFLMLVKRRRIRLHQEVDPWLREALSKAPLREAPVTHEIVMEMNAFDLPHTDPADRFLVATARHLGLTLVTADRRILESKACPTLRNA